MNRSPVALRHFNVCQNQQCLHAFIMKLNFPALREGGRREVGAEEAVMLRTRMWPCRCVGSHPAQALQPPVLGSLPPPVQPPLPPGSRDPLAQPRPTTGQTTPSHPGPASPSHPGPASPSRRAPHPSNPKFEKTLTALQIQLNIGNSGSAVLCVLMFASSDRRWRAAPTVILSQFWSGHSNHFHANSGREKLQAAGQRCVWSEYESGSEFDRAS